MLREPRTLAYLQAILELEEQGIVPQKMRLVEHFQVSMSSVSGNVRRLERDGYLVVHDRALSLTEDGRQLAAVRLRRCRLLEHFLFAVVGVGWEDLASEATRLTSVVSEDVEDALTELLDDPLVCPHGNPVPRVY